MESNKVCRFRGIINTYGMKTYLPKLCYIREKGFVTIVKNFQNFVSLCVNIFCYACGILLIFYRKAR